MYKGEPLDLLKRYNTCGDRLRNLGLPTLQYRRIRADLVETQNHPQCRQGRLPTYFQSEKQIIEVINIKYLKKTL